MGTGWGSACKSVGDACFVVVPVAFLPCDRLRVVWSVVEEPIWF